MRGVQHLPVWGASNVSRPVLLKRQDGRCEKSSRQQNLADSTDRAHKEREHRALAVCNRRERRVPDLHVDDAPDSETSRTTGPRKCEPYRYPKQV